MNDQTENDLTPQTPENTAPPAYNPPPMYSPPPTYTPPPAPPAYAPPPAHTVPTAAEPATEHMSRKTLTFLCVFFACLLVIITLLTYFVKAPETIGSNADPASNSNTPQNVFDIPDNAKNDALNIVVEQVSRPALPDEYYADKASGLFSSIGIPEFVMPSIALIKVYGEDVYSLKGTGSGVIMSANGYIITNAHVLEGGENFSVQLVSGEIYEAKVVGTDSKQDVGVLKIEAEGLTPAVFGKSGDVKLGEEVAVVASAGQNLADAVTFGNVSNVSRKLMMDGGNSVECLQTDAALNPGNSGGPVVNMYGQVIGIVNAKQAYPDSQSGMNLYEGIGFVLKIDNVLETAESIIEYGYSNVSVRVGILYVAIDDYTASYYGVPSGLLVKEVDPTCDIANSGILPGDIITSIDGQKVLSPESIDEVTAGKRPGDIASIEFVRKDLAENVTFYTAEFKYAPVSSLPSNESFSG